MADSTGFAATTPGIADPGSAVCPLLAVALAAGTGSGELGVAGGPSAAAAGRCTATNPFPTISASQRRLVCEDAGHLDCPRYVRAMKGSRGPAGTRGSRGPAVAASAAAIAVTDATTVAAGEAASTAREQEQGPSAAAAPADHATPPTEVASTVDAATLGSLVAAPADGPDEMGSGVGLGSSVADEEAAGPSGDAPAAVAGPLVPAAAVAAEPVAGAASTPPAEAVPSVVDAVPGPVPVHPMTRSSRRSGARPAGSRPLPIAIAAGILVVCLVIAFVFTSIRGGLALPGATPAGGGSAGVGLASPASLVPATVAPSPSPAPASPSASPSPEPTPTATASPAPTASLPAAYAGLKACPDRAACYLYRMRAGDSLTKVAARFGLTLAVIKKANPEIKAPSLLHVGDVIRVPLPKR